MWNADDGFLLTDPVIHTGEGRRPAGRRPGQGRGSNGKTDKGAAGIRLFFESHACNALCRRLGLKLRDGATADSDSAESAPRNDCEPGPKGPRSAKARARAHRARANSES